MSKQKLLKKKVIKKGQKGVHKIPVKQRFVHAMKRIKGMKAMKQRTVALGASKDFIRDVSNFMSKVRNQPQLVKASHRNVLNKHRIKLRKLIHAKTPIEKQAFDSFTNRRYSSCFGSYYLCINWRQWWNCRRCHICCNY